MEISIISIEGVMKMEIKNVKRSLTDTKLLIGITVHGTVKGEKVKLFISESMIESLVEIAMKKEPQLHTVNNERMLYVNRDITDAIASKHIFGDIRGKRGADQ